MIHFLIGLMIGVATVNVIDGAPDAIPIMISNLGFAIVALLLWRENQ